MRIALLTDGIWPFVIGGMQKHSFYLCKYFAQRKVYVELFHTAAEESVIDMPAHFSPEELTYIRSWYIPRQPGDKLPGHYIRTAYKYSHRIFEELKAVMEQQPDIDFIYAKGLTSWSLLKHRHELKQCPPVGINVHGYEYFQKTASIKHKLEQYLLIPAFNYINEHADYIFSYGGKITTIIRKHINNSANKIIEIPTGIERDFLTPVIQQTGAGRNFVFIGRNERRKGVEELNKAIRNLNGKADFHFHFIGDIPDEHRIDAPNIHYHGILRDRNSITAILQQADVLVCPSYSEGMPNVIMEGMASGCAIIASDVGAVNIQVGPENGWLIKPGSVPSLQQAMVSALALKEDELLQMRENSVKKVRDQFLWEQVIDQKIAAIQKIISNEQTG